MYFMMYSGQIMEPNTAGKNKKIRIKKNNNKINNNTTNFVKSISLPPMYNYKKNCSLDSNYIYTTILQDLFWFQFRTERQQMLKKEKKQH